MKLDTHPKNILFQMPHCQTMDGIHGNGQHHGATIRSDRIGEWSLHQGTPQDMLTCLTSYYIAVYTESQYVYLVDWCNNEIWIWLLVLTRLSRVNHSVYEGGMVDPLRWTRLQLNSRVYEQSVDPNVACQPTSVLDQRQSNLSNMNKYSAIWWCHLCDVIWRSRFIFHVT